MAWEIQKEFHFSASHQLSGLPEGHQCARLHGHNYILVVRLRDRELREPGFVLDYGEMGFVKAWADKMDHRHLNDIFRGFNPTSENIVSYLQSLFRYELNSRGLNGTKVDVGLSETPKTWAWYVEE